MKQLTAILTGIFILSITLISCAKEEQPIPPNFDSFVATYNGSWTSNGVAFPTSTLMATKTNDSICTLNGTYGPPTTPLSFTDVNYKVYSTSNCDIVKKNGVDTVSGYFTATTLFFTYRYHTSQPDSNICSFYGTR